MRKNKYSYSAADDPNFPAPVMAAAGDSGLVRMEGLNQPTRIFYYIWLGKLNEGVSSPVSLSVSLLSRLSFSSAEDSTSVLHQKRGNTDEILLLIRFLCIL